MLEEFEEASLIEVSLVTGKRNQIRLQARLHGNDLVGERLYVRSGLAEAIASSSSDRPCTRPGWSSRHPLSGQVMKFEAPSTCRFFRLFFNI